MFAPAVMWSIVYYKIHVYIECSFNWRYIYVCMCEETDLRDCIVFFKIENINEYTNYINGYTCAWLQESRVSHNVTTRNCI